MDASEFFRLVATAIRWVFYGVGALFAVVGIGFLIGAAVIDGWGSDFVWTGGFLLLVGAFVAGAHRLPWVIRVVFQLIS